MFKRCGRWLVVGNVMIQLLVMAISAFAGSIEVNWRPNSEPDLSGYRVHYGTSSRQYANHVDVGKTTTFVVNNLNDNVEYFFAVTAYDTASNESAYSEEVSCVLGDNKAPVLVSAKLLNETTLEVEFNEKLDRGTSTLADNYSISQGIKVTGVSLLSDRKRVHLNTTKHSPGMTFTLIVNNVQDIALPVNTIAPNSTINYSYSSGSDDNTGPTLVLVTITDPTQVQVTFNERLDKASAETAFNYTIRDQQNNGVQVNSASLDAGGNMVSLKTALHQANLIYTLTIAGVKDERGNPVENNTRMSYQYTPPDTIGPTIQLVSAIDATHLDVLFNEAVEINSAETIANYTISGDVTVVSARLNATRNLVHLETTAHSVGQLYLISISGVRDVSPQANLIQPNSQYSYTFVPPDNIGPTVVRVDVADLKNLLVSFNEELDPGSAENTKNYQISDGVQVITATLDQSRKAVSLVTTEHLGGKSYTLTLNGIKDASPNGNEILANTRYTYSTPGGDPPPTIVQVEIKSSTSIAIQFSTELDRNLAEMTGNYKIDPGIQIASARLDPTNTTVELNTGMHGEGQTYTLSVSGLRSKSGVPIQPNLSYTYLYAPADNVGPTIAMVRMRDATHIEILFSEQIDKVSGEKASNYRINGGIEVQRASIDGTGKVISLETSRHLVNKLYLLTVNGVTDSTPRKNPILANSQYGYIYEPEDSAGPLISKVTLVDSRHLDIIFNEPLERTSAEVTGNYSISGNISVNKAILNSNGYTVHLGTDDHITGKLYILTVNGIRDASPAGNLIQPNSAYHYVYDLSASALPNIVNVFITDATTITVVFNKQMEKSSAENSANYRLNNGMQILSARLQSSQNEVLLTTTRHEKNKVYVLMVSNVAEARPPAATVMPNTPFVYIFTGGTSAAPVITSITILGETLVNVTFDKELDRLSAENRYNFNINNGINVLSSELDRSQRIVYLKTSRHRVGQAYVMIVTGVRDLGGTPIESGNTGAYAFFPSLEVAMVGDAEVEMSYLELNKPYYVDRNYVITDFPRGFDFMRMLKTKNDDKDNNAQDYLTFRVTQEALIYVAYDSRATAFPRWLTGNFTRTQMYIGVSDKSERLDLWGAKVNPGEVRIGGNKAPVAQSVNSMYIVLITQVPGNFKSILDNPLDQGDDKLVGIPHTVELIQNYPNPFNPETRISFEVPVDKEVKILVYNILGQTVRTLYNGLAATGRHTVIWNGTDDNGNIVSAGMYFYRLEAWNTVERGNGTFVENYVTTMKKMVFLK